MSDKNFYKRDKNHVYDFKIIIFCSCLLIYIYDIYILIIFLFRIMNLQRAIARQRLIFLAPAYLFIGLYTTLPLKPSELASITRAKKIAKNGDFLAWGGLRPPIRPDPERFFISILQPICFSPVSCFWGVLKNRFCGAKFWNLEDPRFWKSHFLGPRGKPMYEFASQNPGGRAEWGND